jgi:hypothetical protein
MKKFKKPRKPFTPEEDEIIRTYVEDDEDQCVIECLRKAAKILNRNIHAVKSRYYLKRGVWRPLFMHAGKHATFNTKNYGGKGKGRSDLHIVGNTCKLKYRTVKFTLTFV